MIQFNKITRGNKRQANTEQDLFEVLDAGFLCHVAFTHQGQPMMIPTAYGRKGSVLYLHGSTQNFMLNTAIQNEKVCISVTHLDGIVLAKSLFNTSVNYRSAVLFGRFELIEDPDEKLESLHILTEHIIPGRWNEVELGTDQQMKATMAVKFIIESASVKIRKGDPAGDEAIETSEWSGHIPLKQVACKPVLDTHRNDSAPLSKSVIQYLNVHAFDENS
jgi:nitroimidazol reductase NimA-like FMN-containing flavoprotein (pyridoxamine 5'-phosphate oxidase superfamily)